MALYVPTATLFAWSVGRVVQIRTLERQRSDGAWRGELASMLNRVGLVAASCGQSAQRATNARLYAGIDHAWRRQNVWVATMLMFTEVSTFLSQRLLAYVPALPALFAGGMTFRSYVASSELTAELIGGASWFTNVMSEIAVLRANAARLTELAAAIERVRDRDRFYAETGRSAFRRCEIIDGPMLAIHGLELCHRGHEAPPFVTVSRLVLRRGDRLRVSGPSGSGKSSLLKAVAGLWPYGEGRVAVAAGARVFLAAQEADLPERLTLKELVTYPQPCRSLRRAGGRRGPVARRSRRLHPRARPRAASRAGRGATCFPAGRSSAWSSRGCCCRSRTSFCSTRPPRRSIRKVRRTFTTPWSNAFRLRLSSPCCTPMPSRPTPSASHTTTGCSRSGPTWSWSAGLPKPLRWPAPDPASLPPLAARVQ